MGTQLTSTLILPFSGVNLKAFDKRLNKIFSSLSMSKEAYKSPTSEWKDREMFFFSERSEKEYTDTSMNLMTFPRSEEHTSELQSREKIICRLMIEQKIHK